MSPPPPDPAIELSLLHYNPSQSAADHIARFEKLVSLAYPAASESRKWSLFAKTLTPPNFHSPPSVVSSTTSGTSQDRKNHRRHASYAAESEESPIRWLQQVERSQDIPFERVKELFVDRWTAPEEREPRHKAEKSGKRRSKSQPPPGWGAGSKTSSVVSVDSTKARLGYESSVCDTESTVTTATTIVPSRSVVSTRSRSGYRHEANASESVKIGLSVLEREGAGNRIVLHFPDQKPRKRRGTVSRRSSPPLLAPHPPLPGRPASTPFASSPFAPPPPPPPRMSSPPKRYSTPPLRAVQDISYVSRRGDGKVIVPTVRPIAIRPPAIKVPPRPTIEDVEDVSELDLKAARSTIGVPKALNAVLEVVTPRDPPSSESYNNTSREINVANSKAEEGAAEEELARQRALDEEKERMAEEERAKEEKEKEERLREERLKAEKLREERLREERLREERLREEKIREERLRDERLREEKARAERLREERLREERVRAEKLREERLREERIREERLREERLREERLREERIREERLREERIRQERIREEKLREERRKEQKMREEQLKLERLREEVKMMKEQKEKERQEKLRLETEVREKEERIRRERAEEEERERQRVEQERLEKERVEQERLEKERDERERQKEEQLREDAPQEESPRELPGSEPSAPPVAPLTATPPHLPLRYKTLLITNTNTALGHQVALALASLGANIVAHYYHTSPSDPSIISLITHIRSLSKSGAGSVSIVYGDLGDGGRTADGVVRRAVDACGGVDGAIWCPPLATDEGGFMSWAPRGGNAIAGLIPFVQATIKRMIFQYHTIPTDPRPVPHQTPDFPIICVSPHTPPSFSNLYARSTISSVVQACAWEFAGYGVRVNSVGVGEGPGAGLDDIVDAVEWLVGPRSRGVNGVEIPVGLGGRAPSPCPPPGWW